MLTRNKIVEEAILNCYRELYRKAQPSADYDQILKDYKDGKIDESETPVYQRYYLSYEEYNYIIKKYIEAYKLKAVWQDNVEIVENYLNEGGTKNKYISAHEDENGDYHPGYRSYDDVPPLKDCVTEILKSYISDENLVNEAAGKITKKTLDNIKECKYFYRFDREEGQFHMTIGLGASPTSNKKDVIEYWKKQGVNVEIEERNPLLFWETEYYGDELDEIMTDEYGEDWRKVFDDKWKEQVRKKKEEMEKRKKEISGES